MAEKLIKVAALRELRQAPVLNPPEGVYDEFSARFPYEETDDQEASIGAVLGDLASGRPMDRLICGDVGFGKTEVALRASLIAVLAGKQVAVVVPTTLLARQHFHTFTERFRGFPVKIAQASRLVEPQGARRGEGGDQVGRHRYRHRHPCSARQGHRVRRSRAADRRRGAAFRRAAQRAPEAAPRGRARADADRHADSPHAAIGAVGGARDVADLHPAGRPARRAHLCDAVRSRDPARGAAARALPRRPDLLRRAAHLRSRRGRSLPQGACARA